MTRIQFSSRKTAPGNVNNITHPPSLFTQPSSKFNASSVLAASDPASNRSPPAFGGSRGQPDIAGKTRRRRPIFPLSDDSSSPSHGGVFQLSVAGTDAAALLRTASASAAVTSSAVAGQRHFAFGSAGSLVDGAGQPVRQGGADEDVCKYGEDT